MSLDIIPTQTLATVKDEEAVSLKVQSDEDSIFHKGPDLTDPNDPTFKALEKKVIRKFDFIIIPCLALAYLFSNLDKTNIGNAEAAGMSDDLGLVGNQYGNVVSLLFVTYVIFETPIAISLKYVGAKYGLSFLCLFFGITCLCTSFVQGYHSLLACRMLLGLFESGIIPVINVYLGMLYTRNEMAKRCSAVYCASAAAGGFGGLLAFGLIKINAHGWEGWRWLFAIEGVLTICAFPILIILLPRDPTEAWWLTSDEKKVLITRFKKYADFYQDEKFSWSEIKRGLIEFSCVMIYLYEFCADLTLFGISTFLPSIIRGMGYNKYETQLLTIPFYAIAFLSFVGVGYFSDKLQHRGGFILGGLIFEIIGYAILVTVDSLGARYFACMMIGVGIYVCSALSIMWINNNSAGHYKRATAGGMITTIGSCAGVLAGQIFTAETAPRYLKGLRVGLALTCGATVFIVAMMYNYQRQNTIRAKKVEELVREGVEIPDEKPKDDLSIHFKFIL